MPATHIPNSHTHLIFWTWWRKTLKWITVDYVESTTVTPAGHTCHRWTEGEKVQQAHVLMSASSTVISPGVPTARSGRTYSSSLLVFLPDFYFKMLVYFMSIATTSPHCAMITTTQWHPATSPLNLGQTLRNLTKESLGTSIIPKGNWNLDTENTKFLIDKCHNVSILKKISLVFKLEHLNWLTFPDRNIYC